MEHLNDPQIESRIERRRAGAKQEFVAAARAVIEENGFARFSFELVAEKIGLRKQAVYHYFPSKEAIIEAIALGLSNCTAEVTQAIRDCPAKKVECARDVTRATLALARSSLDIGTAVKDCGSGF